MIHRATDASLHNAIANHAQVLPTLSYSGEYADFSPLLEHPETYILLHDGSGVASIWEWSAPNIWQGHSMALPESRGRGGLEAGKAMIRWMFDHGAEMLWGQTPLNNRPALMFTRLIGGKPSGQGVHHIAGPVQYFTFERE